MYVPLNIFAWVAKLDDIVGKTMCAENALN